MDLAPNRTKLLRLSKERTKPMAAPAKATTGSDLDPISSSWRSSSRPSNGRRTAMRMTCHRKRPRSPNHSRKRLIRFQKELEVARRNEAGGSASGLNQRRGILASLVSIGMLSGTGRYLRPFLKLPGDE